MDSKLRKNFTIRIDPDLHEAIKIQAILEKRSVSDILNELIREYLKDKPR